MTADIVLSRLERVRRSGADSWVASCPGPTHRNGDRHPSLHITEKADGVLLLHCFSGCEPHEIVSAIGLNLSDLFPERGPLVPGKSLRRPFDALAILNCVTFEAEIAAVAADNIANGMALTDADRTRLRLAAIRLREAQELANV